MTHRRNLSVNAVARRSGLVTERHTLVFRRKLLYQLADRRRRVVDLADKTHLTIAPTLSNRHRIT
jgi:hypothetical protein